LDTARSSVLTRVLRSFSRRALLPNCCEVTMNILDAVLGAQNGGAVQHIGRQFGLSDEQVSRALSALVPALAAGFQRNAASPQGLDGLIGALAGGSHQRYVDDPSTLGDAGTVADGNGILGHILGSKDVSRQVASQASAQTGIGESALKAMLPVVAAMMMGSMSKRMANPAGMAAGGAGGADLLSMLTPMLDSNRDGSVVDDVAGMVGKLLSGR
jgi:hypothetical protein